MQQDQCGKWQGLQEGRDLNCSTGQNACGNSSRSYSTSLQIWFKPKTGNSEHACMALHEHPAQIAIPILRHSSSILDVWNMLQPYGLSSCHCTKVTAVLALPRLQHVLLVQCCRMLDQLWLLQLQCPQAPLPAAPKQASNVIL